MRGRVTDRTVAGLVPGARDTFLWDDQLAGFGVKVTARGRRSYVFQYRMGGRETATARVTIGVHGEPWSAASARVEAERLRACAAAGEDPRRPRMGAAASPPGEAPLLAAADWRIRLGLLITDIARLQTVAMRRTVEALGGSSEQARLLGELSLHQGRSQAELAKALDLSKVAVSGLVARATRAGWIEQRDHPTDRRTRQLYLTPRARQGIAAMRDEIDRMNEQIYAETGQEMGQAAIDILQRLRRGWLSVARPDDVE